MPIKSYLHIEEFSFFGTDLDHTASMSAVAVLSCVSGSAASSSRAMWERLFERCGIPLMYVGQFGMDALPDFRAPDCMIFLSKYA